MTEVCEEDSLEYSCLKYYDFTAIDYIVFVSMLILSCGIGLYFAYRSRQNETLEDYLLANKSMHFFPTSLSLMCTTLSAVTILGTPAEFYNYGGMYIWTFVAFFICICLSAEVFIPIFYNLNVRSTYEYLEMRFNKTLRTTTMILFIIAGVMSMGVAIYAPATAISAVTSMDLNLAILSTGLVCVFYTTLGGMKAVVWTDVIQSAWMISGLFAITVYSAVNIGYGEIFETAKAEGRAEFFVSSWDPTVRNSMQAFLLGKTFGLDGYAFCVSQAFVQRYISCKSLNHARWSAYMALPFLGLVLFLCLTSGYALLVYFKSCDPAAVGFLETTDQLMPYLTTYLFEDFPGVSAIYVSGAFAGSLSTVSSTLSSMANVILNDLLAPYTRKFPEKTQLLICKGLVIILGACCIGFAYMAALLKGGILEAALSINGIVGGATFAIFFLGVFVPFQDSIGASVGLISGVGISTWMYIGRNLLDTPTEILIKANKLPVRYDGCIFENGTIPIIEPPIIEDVPNSGLLSFYNISVHYIGTLGFLTAVVTGFTTSLIIFIYKGRVLNRQQKDRRLQYFLLDKPIFCCVPQSFKRFVRCGIETSDEECKSEKSSNSVESIEVEEIERDDISTTEHCLTDL